MEVRATQYDESLFVPNAANMTFALLFATLSVFALFYSIPTMFLNHTVVGPPNGSVDLV